MSRKQGYTRLTPKMALLLAAPHTWAASIIPSLLGAALCVYRGVTVDAGMFLLLTIVCVLMQSAVNTFNDYADYVKGTDTLENSPDADDAVLVYNNPSPRAVLLLGFGFLAVAAAASVPSILKCGIRPVLVGLVGAAAVLLYSFGKKPLSYLPMGEFVSGIVMGGLIPFAVSGVLTDHFELITLFYSIPTIISVALIMMTNNSCDIERDIASGRSTFAVKLGSKRSAAAYRIGMIAWLIMPIICMHSAGCIIYFICAVAAMPQFVRHVKLELSPATRGMAMGGITNLNLLLGLAYCFALACSGMAKLL